MSVIIHRGDYRIEVSTEAELRMVLGVLGGIQLPLMPVNGHVPVVQGEAIVVTPEQIWAVANSNAREYMRVLAQHPVGLTDDAFRQLLGLQNNGQLGARTTAAVRAIKRANADPNVLLIRTQEGNAGNRTYTYRLEGGLAEAINQAEA